MSVVGDTENVLPEYLSVRRSPVNYEGKDALLFAREWQKTMPAVTLRRLHNVWITPSGILSDGRAILPDSFDSEPVGHAFWRWQLRFWTQGCLPRMCATVEEPLWFTWPSALSGFHWLMDSLTRLAAVRSQFKCPTLLLPATCRNRSLLEASLRAFEPCRVVYVPSYRTLRCPELYVPTKTAPTGNFRDPLVRDMRQRYRSRFLTPASSALGERIYVSRGKARMRKIANERDVEAVLKKYGFKTVYFEDYPFERQVAIAGQARYLVSNHGAGLTNMLFMPPGARVLEIRQAGDCYRNCFFSLASALEIGYFYQVCEPTFELKDVNRDIRVDSAAFEKNVVRMLEGDNLATCAGVTVKGVELT